eukprot:s181_g23.t1
MRTVLTAAAEVLLWPFGIRRRSGKRGDSEQDGDGGDWEVDPAQFVAALSGASLAYWAWGRMRSQASLQATPSLEAAPPPVTRIPLSEFLSLLRDGAAVSYLADRPPAGALLLKAAVPTLTTLASQSGKSALSPLPVEKSMETLLLPGSHQGVFEDYACDSIFVRCSQARLIFSVERSPGDRMQIDFHSAAVQCCKCSPMCQSAINGLLRLLGLVQREDFLDDGKVPEVFRQRYARYPESQPLPLLLQQVLEDTTPAEEPKAYFRPRRKFPLHFLHGTLQSSGLSQAVYYFQADDKDVIQKVFVHWSLDTTLEGPPGCCHGGCSAALIDDAFGAFANTYLRSLGRSGRAATAYLHVDYKAMTPLPSRVVCIVTLDRAEGRKIFLKGRMVEASASLQTTCEASALFAELKDKTSPTELRSRSDVQFECREVAAGSDSEINRLSLLIDLGGLVASLGALWYLFRSNGQTFAAKHLEENRDFNRRPAATFDDVAGMENTKEELQEVIAYLRDPNRFYALGARPPRGILLAGPSGTGKTLMARAVAGEAGVPFLYASSASFVEIFVGQGAQRIRQFFEQARACAPCIVFLDELDAVGSSRQMSASGGGGNQEYAQTLNQLLLELDGVESNIAGCKVYGPVFSQVYSIVDYCSGLPDEAAERQSAFFDNLARVWMAAAESLPLTAPFFATAHHCRGDRTRTGNVKVDSAEGIVNFKNTSLLD